MSLADRVDALNGDLAALAAAARDRVALLAQLVAEQDEQRAVRHGRGQRVRKALVEARALRRAPAQRLI